MMNNKLWLLNVENMWFFYKNGNRIRLGMVKKFKYFKFIIVDVNYGCFNYICKKIVVLFDGDR